MGQRFTVRGVVKSLSESMAIVTPLDAPAAPQFMTIDAVAQYGELPLASFLSIGDVLDGEYDAGSMRFFPDFGKETESTFVNRYPDGSVVLAYVARSKASEGTVYVHPDIPVIVKRADISTNELDQVNHLWAVGDIVRGRVSRNSKGGLRLTALDVDDDEPVSDAPTLVDATGPWLTVSKMDVIESVKAEIERQHAEQVALSTALEVLSKQMELDIAELQSLLNDHHDSLEAEVAPSVPDSTATVSGRDRANAQFAEAHFRRIMTNYQVELDKAARRNRELADQLRAARHSESAAKGQAETYKAQLSTARQDLQEAVKQAKVDSGQSTITSRRTRYFTAEEWIAEEVRRFWLAAYEPADRVTFPLDRQPWRVLPSFAETFSTLDDDAKLKALKVITYVVTGRNALEHILEDHALRHGDESSRPEVTRSDGAACRRIYLESHTPQARRMHYWKLRDGSIELSRIGLHDDFTP